MKNQYLPALLLLCFPLLLSAQEVPTSPLNTKTFSNWTIFSQEKPTPRNNDLSRRWAVAYTSYDGDVDTITFQDSTRTFFNNANLPIEDQRWRNNPDSPNLVLYRRTLYDAYDASENLLHSLIQERNAGAWENYRQTSFVYDANGNETKRTTDQWDGTAWQFSSEETRTYNNANLVDTVTYNFQREIFEYDQEDRLVHYLFQFDLGLGWENSFQYMQVFDASGLLEENLTQLWVLGEWINDSKSTFSYDLNGMLLSELQEIWLGGAWENRALSMLEYNANGLGESTLFKRWNNGLWVNNTLYLAYFDANDNVIRNESKKWRDNDWHFTFVSRLYYETLSQVNDFSNAEPQFKLSPNPATNFISLETDLSAPVQAQIFDSQGKLILSKSLQNTKTERIDLRSIPAGAYFLRVTGEHGQVSSKPFIVGADKP